MQPHSRMTILMIVVLAGSLPAAQPGVLQTRAASCLVRITVDPAIVPLDPATLQGLLHSSAVAGAALREVLQQDSIENPWEELIEMEWLNESAPRSSRSGAPNEQEGHDTDMMAELEQIYGAQYMQQMTGGEDSATRERRKKPSVRVSPYAGQSWPVSGPGQSVTIRLSVRLPEGLPPVADTFLRAMISNLRSSLRHAYEVHISDLSDQLTLLQGQYNTAVDTLQGGTDPATRGIKEQLDTVVDLSVLTPEMPVAEAVAVLKKSVEPPLQIVVLWRDLADNADIEPASPIEMDGLPNVAVRTALEALLAALGAGHTELSYRIRGGVITIGTADTLDAPAGPPPSGPAPQTETDLQALAAQKTELARAVRSLELELGGQEARRRAIAEQIARTQAEAQVRLEEDEVTRELKNLVELSAENLSTIRKLVDSGHASTGELGQATEGLTRARIELAKRREELSQQAGGGQLEQLSGELSRIAIDGAEKQAQRSVLQEQLDQVKQQLARAATFDPEAARRRVAREALDILARRVAELQTRIANLQPPMVAMIGAN